MAMTRRNMLHLFLGLGGAAIGVGTAGLVRPQGRSEPLPPTPGCEDGDAEPTEHVTAGPFYTPNSPERTVLREPGIVGAPLVLTGRVLSPGCRPLAGAVLDFWSCDGNGVYDTEGFRLRGHQRTDASGAYRLETVKPSSYVERGMRRTPHIHVRVQGRGTGLLTTQIFFPGEPLNAQDWLFEESLLMTLAGSSRDGSLAGRFDFVLA
jgi:protocatechuate 3,4-dioxygenase beta subunit